MTIDSNASKQSYPECGAGRCKTRPFRPPLVYSFSLVTGVLIHLATPLQFVPGTLSKPIGASIVPVAIVLFVYSVAKFRKAGTPVPARNPTTRNPIYLAFSLFQLGIAIWINGLARGA